jgi:hypothetical protein
LSPFLGARAHCWKLPSYLELGFSAGSQSEKGKAEQIELEFPASFAWLTFTDQVSHAAMRLSTSERAIAQRGGVAIAGVGTTRRTDEGPQGDTPDQLPGSGFCWYKKKLCNCVVFVLVIAFRILYKKIWLL